MSSKRSLNAVLLSALVFPGAGQLYLKRALRGLLFAAPAALSLLLLGQHLYAIAMLIVEQIESGALAAEPQAILDAIAAATATGNAWLADLAQYLFLACWLLSIWDAYRIGKKP